MFSFLKPAYLKRYVARYVRFNMMRKGLLGGSRLWMGVFGLSVLGRFLGRITKGGEAPVVFSDDLEPGGTYQIVHVPNPKTTRRARRAAKKNRKKAAKSAGE